MPPLDVNLRNLIEQVDLDLPDATELAKVSEAQQRARSLNDIGDQMVDHFVTRARAAGAPWSQIGEALGVTKQAAQQRWLPTIFQRYTDKARHVVVLAQERARSYKHDYIGTEHILLGVVGEIEGLAAKILTDLGGHPDAVKEALGEVLTPGNDVPPARIPFTPKSKKVLEESGRAAQELGHDYIGTEHLLLGLFRVENGAAAQALARLDISPDRVQEEVRTRVAAMLAARPDAADQ